MSNLIKQFKENLQLAGYAKRSINSYVSSVLRLQHFYNKHLEDITQEELRQYWLCCQSEFGWSAATLRISYSGIQHFFKRLLKQDWELFSQIKWKREQTLPTILSLKEVRQIINALPTLQSQTFYLTLYSLGLRLREATTLQVRDILSDRGLVHIHAGKGAIDRMVPLPSITLTALRRYYKTARPWGRDKTLCVIFQGMCSGLQSSITVLKALKMVSSNLCTKTVKRKSGKLWHWMP